MKARSTGSFGKPLSGVTDSKTKKIRKAAEQYRLKKRLENVDCRFDVVTIDESGDEPLIEIIRNAF